MKMKHTQTIKMELSTLQNDKEKEWGLPLPQ